MTMTTENISAEQGLPPATEAPTDSPAILNEGVQDTAAPEVSPTPEATEAPVATPAPTKAPVVRNVTPAVRPTQQKATADVQVAEVAQKAEPTFEETVAAFKKVALPVTQGLISSLEKYLDKMAPKKPISPAAGSLAQYELWLALRSVLGQDPDTFKQAWNLFLGFVNQHSKGCFNEYNAFRFADQWQWSTEELHAYQCLLNLSILTADPLTRSTGLKQVDLGRSTSIGFTETAKNNLIMFYS